MPVSFNRADYTNGKDVADLIKKVLESSLLSLPQSINSIKPYFFVVSIYSKTMI